MSNWGSCVKVYAPGQDIRTTWLASSYPAATVSGTSFAAPHVTGVAALYKAVLGDAPSDVVANWITTNATAGVITGNPPGTPNLLVFTVLPGNLTVTTTTTGSSLPPDGYTYTVTVEIYAPAATGNRCSNNGECATGFCADGVCCNVACTAACVACTADTAQCSARAISTSCWAHRFWPPLT